MPSRTGRSLALVAATLLVFACADGRPWLPGRDYATADVESVEATGVSLYLQSMYRLATAAPEEQQKLFGSISRSADRAPTTTNRLRLALARSVSGHPGSDPEQARRELEGLLDDPALLTESERQLATVMLKEIDSQHRLADISAETLAQSSQMAAAERERLMRSLDAARAEQARLQQALAEAEEKLRAITTIERSIREQTDDERTP